MKNITEPHNFTSTGRTIAKFSKYFEETPKVVIEEEKKIEYKPFSWDEPSEVL